MKLFAKLFSVSLLFIGANLMAQPTCNWAFFPTSTNFSQNVITAQATDKFGNNIEIGKTQGIADMDPGTGAADTSFTPYYYTYYIVKYSAQGQLLWINYIENNSQLIFFEFKSLKINDANEILIAGNFSGALDFDLSSSGIDTLRSQQPTYFDYFLAKYDSAGNYQWALNGGNPTSSGTKAQALNILPNQNILLIINPTGVTDVDPGSAIHNTIASNANIVCYNTNGNYVWNNNIAPLYSYGVSNNSLGSDSAANSYLLSVGSYELTVTKFDSSGVRLWGKKIGDFSNGSRVNPQSVLVDKSNGCFYIAGTFQGAVDFDPGNSTLIHTSSSGFFGDGFIAKYDNNMNPMWINPYVGKVVFGNYSLDFDGSEIIAVGSIEGAINFGNNLNLSATTSNSPFYLRIDTLGNTISGYALSGTGIYNTVSQSINNSIVITGLITTGSIDMDPSASVLLLNPASANYFTAAYQFPISTSIEAITFQNDKQIQTYPNPFENELILKVTQASDVIIQITDLAGRTIFKCKNSFTQIIVNTQEWPKGVYFLRVNEQSFKLIKN
jgi:hypothetical protein